MESRQPEKGPRKLKKSVHRCPKCAFEIDLKDLGLRRSTTGLVTCPKCEWSGPVNIGIAEKEP